MNFNPCLNLSLKKRIASAMIVFQGHSVVAELDTHLRIGDGYLLQRLLSGRENKKLHVLEGSIYSE